MTFRNSLIRRGRSWGGLTVCLLLALSFLVGCEVTYVAPAEEDEVRIGGVELFRSIDTINSESMALAKGKSGTIWVVTKYDVIRFPCGDLEKKEQILDPQIFQARFKTSMNALSSAAYASDGMLWIGTWSGEVFSFDRGTWRNYIPEDHGLGGKISGIFLTETADRMWIGARDAVWQAVKKGNTLGFVLEAQIEALTRSAGGRVAAATSEEVYAGDGENFELLWSRDSEDRITALSSQGESWLVGTHNGFFKLGPTGEVGERQLEGRWVSAFLDHPGGRVVGAWQSGLWFEEGGEWLNLSTSHDLPDDSVSALLVDDQQRLWIGLYGAGTLVADLAGLRREARRLGRILR